VTAPLAADGRPPVRIRDIVAAPGEKRRGHLVVGHTAAGPIVMPVVVIHSTRPGPTLCLTGAVHGTEYPGTTAVRQLARDLQPDGLAGTVIAVTVTNMPMYQGRSPFISPIDGLNLNRVAPGRADGTITERIAHTLFTEVLSLATHHIDCHGGDLTEELWPYAAYRVTGNRAQDEVGEAMVRVYTPRIFALMTEKMSLAITHGTVTSEAARRGIASILGECGSAGGLDPADVETHLRGIGNVMRYLGMLPGQPAVAAKPLQGVAQFVVAAGRGGLLRLAVAVGDEIGEGQVLGEIWDEFGEVIETLRAPARGLIRLVWTHKVVNTGDLVLKCWVTEPAAPFPLTDRFAN
jgi:predicted deacylase